MASQIVRHWRGLTSVTPPVVHPEDAAVFKQNKDGHSFNLQYPPPAYVGDVDNAPAIILNSNGGYDPTRTPNEFNAITPDEYLRYLHNPGPVNREKIAQYYRKLNFVELLENGSVAIVNAVAYRSVKLSKEPQNERIAERLPSVQVHRRWLYEEVLPQARKGERLLFLKRARLWKLTRRDADGRYIIDTSGHIPGLEHKDMSIIRAFIG